MMVAEKDATREISMAAAKVEITAEKWVEKRDVSMGLKRAALMVATTVVTRADELVGRRVF